MFENSDIHIDSSLPTLGNASKDLNNNPVNPFQANWIGFNSQRLLALAGETLINAWQNQTNPTQALVYTTASIFNPNFAANAQVAFGKDFDVSKAEALGADILGGIYGVLPDVKFLSNAEINGALGAYAKSTNTIYLNSIFLTQNTANPTAIGKVLVEETGHFLDVYASPIDSPGDEGDILARLTNDEEISNEALKALKSEDDRGIVLLSQGSLEVEQALISGNSLNNSLYGTSSADSIYGYAGNDYLSGGDGDDALYGGDGNDVLDGGFGFDFLDGGNGIDQVTYNFYSGGINLNLQTGVVSFPGNSTRTDTVVNVEDVIGSSGNDTILGNALSNNLIGGNGDDTIRGGDGDDVLDGGFGFDFLEGGNGRDTVSYDFYNGGITLNLRTGVVSFPGNSTLTETVVNIEAVIGSRGNDILTGDSFNNSLNGNNGNDVLDAYGSGLLERDDLLGGLGSDRFVLGDANNTYYTRSGNSDLAAIADFRIGEDTIQLRQLSNSVTSSSQAYGYRLITVGNSTEIRLDNNELIAILNGVTGLSLTSSAFQFVGAADLIIQNQSAPSSATVGSTVNISAYTKNNGLVTAGGSYVRYWLSNDTTLDNNDTFLNYQYVNSLGAGASGYNSLSFTYNSAWGTGSKYILFQADGYDYVAESNELNNLAFAAINITQSLPDLIIQNQSAPSSATVGSTVNISAYTKNNGLVTAGGSYVRYWLSNDTTLDNNDTFLNYQYVNSLGAGASGYNSLSFTYNSAWGTGSKYILFQADGYDYVAESNELNNLAFAAINITQPLPDLIIQNQSAPSSATIGSTVSISAYTKNNGLGTAGASTVRYWLSNDTTLDNSDIAIGSQSLGSLGAGVFGYNSLSFTYNSAWGTGSKYILFQADGYGYVTESNELNNLAFAAITINSDTVKAPGVTKFNKTGNTDIDALLSTDNYKWDTSVSNGVITYSFLGSAGAANYKSGTSLTDIVTVSEVNNAIKTNVRNILKNLESFINVTFKEVADTATSYGVLRYMFASETSDYYAHAYYPNSWVGGGDVHLNTFYENDAINKFSGEIGSYGYEAIIHESLHALGLKHPGNYNGSGTGEGPFLSGAVDNNTNSIMTYNNVGSNNTSPMTYDVRALQYLYGAKDNNSSNTTYSFSQVYGYNLGGQFFGSNNTSLKQTIWDSDGIDTLDLSGLSTTQSYYLDLRENGILTTSTALNSTSYTARGEAGTYKTSTFGTTIAYGTVIENLVNSRGNDTILGNSANNIFQGYSFGTNTGNDVYELTSSSDILELSSYSLSNLSTSIFGNDLKVTLGSYGSITVKNYYGSNNFMKFKVGNSYYRYISNSWQLA